MKIKSLIGLSLSVLVITTACGKEEKAPELNNDSNQKKIEKKHETKEDKKPKDYKQKEEDNKKQDVKDKDTSLNDAIDMLDDLNEFYVTDDEWYSKQLSQFNDEGIEFAGDYSSPYVDDADPVDAEQDNVLSAVIKDKKVEDKKKDSAKVVYTIKAGVTPGIGDDVDAGSQEAQDEMRDNDDAGREYKITYEIEKDGKKWKVKRDAPSDWAK